MHLHLAKRMATVLSAAVAVTFLAVGPAGATVGVTPSNPVPVSAGQATAPITVSWSGLPTSQASPFGRRVFITQCKKSPGDPTFNFTVDCSNLSEKTLNPEENPAGSGSTSYDAFHGLEPSGDESWGCYAPNETPPAGITAYTTCYIRVTQDAQSNLGDQQFTTLSFALTSAVTPEVGNAVLLPVSAAVAVGAGALVTVRRRRRVGLAA